LGHNIGFKRRRKFKEFRGFLEKSVFNSSFSDYEITEKSFIVNMTFNFIRILL